MGLSKVECGKLGGRPKALTIEDIRQQELQKSQENIVKEDGYPKSNNLRELKKLWGLRRRGLTANISPPGGD